MILSVFFPPSIVAEILPLRFLCDLCGIAVKMEEGTAEAQRSQRGRGAGTMKFLGVFNREWTRMDAKEEGLMNDD